MILEDRPFRRHMSLLPGIYFLVALVSVFFAFSFLLLLQLLYTEITFVDFKSLLPILGSTLRLNTQAIVLASPMAFSLSFLLLSRKETWLGVWLQRLYGVTNQWPYLLYGPLFLGLTIPHRQNLLLILVWVAVSLLSRVWLTQSRKISWNEVETFRALGSDYRKISYQLYFRKFWFQYLAGTIASLLYLCLLVAPFLWLASHLKYSESPLALVFFETIMGNNQGSVLLLGLFLFIYSVAFFVERKLLDEGGRYG